MTGWAADRKTGEFSSLDGTSSRYHSDIKDPGYGRGIGIKKVTFFQTVNMVITVDGPDLLICGRFWSMEIKSEGLEMFPDSLHPPG